MPACVKKIGEIYRVVECGSDKVVKRNGKAVDGGGHKTEKAAKAQAYAINISQGHIKS